MGKAKEKRIPKGFGIFTGRVKAYLAARGRLALQVDRIRERRVRYTKRLMPGLDGRAADAAACREGLVELLGKHRDKFEKPRTRALEGVRIGWRKPPRKLSVPDPKDTARKIRKLMPGRAKALITVTETVPVGGLKALDDDELEAIGVTIEQPPDLPVVKMAKDSLDRQVEAIRAQHKADFEEAS